MRRRIIFLGLWAATTAVAVLVGVLAVTTVGATLRDRGPVGADVVGGTGSDRAPTPTQTPAGPRIADEMTGEWGAFDVECRDTWAYGVGVRPDEAAGWRVLSWEKGPSDDVDAEFSDGERSVTLEVFCNRGRPTLAEIERDTLGDD